MLKGRKTEIKPKTNLGFLKRNLSACPQDVKESAYLYKGLVRPVLEYGSSVSDPSGILLQEEPEKVQQKMAARFVTSNYIYETGRMTGILEQLKWESLKKKRWRDSRIIKKKSETRSLKSNENIHKKEGGSYYVVSANKALSVTL